MSTNERFERSGYGYSAGKTAAGVEHATQEQVVEVCACAAPMTSMAAADITKVMREEKEWQYFLKNSLTLWAEAL